MDTVEVEAEEEKAESAPSGPITMTDLNVLKEKLFFMCHDYGQESKTLNDRRILPLWPNFTNLWQPFEGLISMSHTFEPTLENSVCFCSN